MAGDADLLERDIYQRLKSIPLGTSTNVDINTSSDDQGFPKVDITVSDGATIYMDDNMARAIAQAVARAVIYNINNY